MASIAIVNAVALGRDLMLSGIAALWAFRHPRRWRIRPPTLSVRGSAPSAHVGISCGSPAPAQETLLGENRDFLEVQA